TRSYGDWSSDVCSSDLDRAGGAHADAGVEDELGALVRGIVRVAGKGAGVAALAVAFEPIAPPCEPEEQAMRSAVRELVALLVAEIGRASCRERVERAGA